MASFCTAFCAAFCAWVIMYFLRQRAEQELENGIFCETNHVISPLMLLELTCTIQAADELKSGWTREEGMSHGRIITASG